MTGKLIQQGKVATIVTFGGKYTLENHGTIVKEEDGFILLEADRLGHPFTRTTGYVWMNRSNILEMFYDDEVDITKGDGL